MRGIDDPPRTGAPGRLLNLGANRPDCRGRALIRAVSGSSGTVQRWEVWFLNEGNTPFLGTVAFTRSAKNDGYGLESMACPQRGAAAMQPIWATRSYGVRPAAGEPVRIGVRGYGWAEVALPEAGQLVE